MVFPKKRVFLKISQYLQENACASVSFFHKVETLFKKEILAQAFSCEFREIFKNTFFVEHIRTNASVYYLIIFLN